MSTTSRKRVLLYSKPYDPLAAGSIDGTDTIPHDRAICQAVRSKYNLKKKKISKGSTKSDYTLFVGRLPLSLSEAELLRKFSKLGEVKSCDIIYDLVTGMSKGYGFVEYHSKDSAVKAYHELNGTLFDSKPALIDWKVSDSLEGWKPRRIGGGWGGRKESGQLRFGCRDKPWHKPIVLPPQNYK